MVLNRQRLLPLFLPDEDQPLGKRSIHWATPNVTVVQVLTRLLGVPFVPLQFVCLLGYCSSMNYRSTSSTLSSSYCPPRKKWLSRKTFGSFLRNSSGQSNLRVGCYHLVALLMDLV